MAGDTTHATAALPLTGRFFQLALFVVPWTRQEFSHTSRKDSCVQLLVRACVMKDDKETAGKDATSTRMTDTQSTAAHACDISSQKWHRVCSAYGVFARTAQAMFVFAHQFASNAHISHRARTETVRKLVHQIEPGPLLPTRTPIAIVFTLLIFFPSAKTRKRHKRETSRLVSGRFRHSHLGTRF